jgi:ABC-2 type transport system permease protein
VNWRGVRAVVRRDLTVAAGSRAVVLPAIIVPALLLVVLPLVAGLLPGVVDMASAGDLEALLGVLPAGALDGLPDDLGLQAAYVSVVYLLAPMVLLVPVMFASVIAADGMAGEKERGTLEGLLLTPLTDGEIATAKLLAAWIPAVAIGVGGAVVYAVVGNLAVGLQLDRLVLPTLEFAIMALWVGPMFAAAALGAVSLVSVRVSSTQEAFQVGGVVVLPVVALMVSQASGALLLSPWVLVVAGVVGAALAAGLVAAGAASLSRARLGPRLG